MLMVTTPTIPQLVETIRTLIGKGDHATDKAEQYYISAGRHLKTLKERDPETWLEIAKEQIKIGRSRAYELIAIGEGQRSVEQTRHITDLRTRKSRKNKAR